MYYWPHEKLYKFHICLSLYFIYSPSAFYVSNYVLINNALFVFSLLTINVYFILLSVYNSIYIT